MKIKKYWLITFTSLQNNLTYSSNFLFSGLFYIFIIFIFLMLWGKIYNSGNTIAGYTLNQMIWYCIITELIVLTRGNFYSSISNDIKSGNVAYLLNKPFHYIWYLFSNNFGEIAIRFGINATFGICIGFLYIGSIKHFEIWNIPLITITIILGILINFFMYAIIGLTAFWFEDNEAFYWINSKLTQMLGMFIPIDFFPDWLKSSVEFLPYSFITYGPAKLFVDFSLERFIMVVTMQLLYLLIFIGITFLVYERGVKKLNVNGG